MATDYGFTKAWISESEAQELHEAIGLAIETGDLTGLVRAREIAAVLLADVIGEDE